VVEIQVLNLMGRRLQKAISYKQKQLSACNCDLSLKKGAKKGFVLATDFHWYKQLKPLRVKT